MATYQNQNQFQQTPLLGQVDLTVNPSIISAKVYGSSSSTKLQAGQAVKLVDQAGAEIIVDEAALGDIAIGIIPYNPRKSLYVAGDTVEVATRGSVVYLETSAAIARGAKVALDPSGPTIATRSSTYSRVGIVLDKPAAANVLARVLIDPADQNGVI